MIIGITKEDKDHGVMSNPDRCPIALAGSRFFRRPCKVWADVFEVIGPGGGVLYSFKLPKAVEDAIAEYDLHGVMTINAVELPYEDDARIKELIRGRIGTNAKLEVFG